MIYSTDYHIHTTYSDGRSVPEDYVAQALNAGLKEIGFSEHLTLFREPEDWNIKPGDHGGLISAFATKAEHEFIASNCLATAWNVVGEGDHIDHGATNYSNVAHQIPPSLSYRFSKDRAELLLG